ncbi:molybdate transport system substrate-binding protein [Rheinheimera pacifica]|uniref:molybdate ABC transporter substrate-binding protein n=1 Tax=Rheinheimera pacifica TaxID=173990 RepID=UPI002168895A|nr:molybdate ABC transporter substrate-binding protein [Rheinheimera pacifica]MCS4309190.1 molybdate transport system substrate-binding protein [Rheinheimera pacifica]
MLFSIAINAAEPIRIAVAANFNGTLQKLTAKYEQEYGQAFVISAGSSGALYAQIQQAAPFDVFFSADAMRAERLVAENLAIDSSRFTYAVGVPVLWSGDAHLIDNKAEVLRGDAFRHLSIAEPRNAPYGMAAQQILEKLGLWQQLNTEKRLIRAQSIGQAYSQVASGAAPLGFVALAQVIDENGTVPGSYWLAPAEMYQPIVQQAVILHYAERDAATLAAARSFMTWLQSDAAIAIIRQAGYGVE